MGLINRYFKNSKFQNSINPLSVTILYHLSSVTLSLTETQLLILWGFPFALTFLEIKIKGLLKKIIKNNCFISMNTWKTKSIFSTLCDSYFKILLKTINRYIWKKIKNRLDIVVFCPPQIRKIQVPYKQLEHWLFCTRLTVSVAGTLKILNSFHT